MSSPEDKIIEECSELIKAIMKAKRFGWNDFHPDRPDSDNLNEVLDEIEDVQRAISDFRYQPFVAEGTRERIKNSKNEEKSA